MHPTRTRKEKLALYLTILWPILVTQIGYQLMPFFDTVMSGWAGTADLAGVAIGSSLWMPVQIGITGILLSVVPIVAQHLGRGARDRIGDTVTQALNLSFALAVVVVIAGSFALEPILAAMRLDAKVHHIAKHFLIGLSFGIIPLFASNVLRNFIDAQGFTKITMLITLAGIPFNIAVNYVLIFGKLGFPRLGGIGSGYATAVTYWLILVINIVTIFKMDVLRTYRLFVSWVKPSWQAWKELLAVGVPIGLSIFFEASIFSGVTLLVGIMFDTNTIAAHQASINFSSLMFMIPLSMAMALTIVVAYEAGARRIKDARQYARMGVGTAIGFYGLCSVLLYLFRGPIAGLYSDEPAVTALIMQFLVFAVFFQLSDAAQVSLQGVLRGYKDTTVPFITALISYWVIGMPLGYALAAYTELGPFGFWVGITIGLTCAAVGFYGRLRVVQRRLENADLSV